MHIPFRPSKFGQPTEPSDASDADLSKFQGPPVERNREVAKIPEYIVDIRRLLPKVLRQYKKDFPSSRTGRFTVDQVEKLERTLVQFRVNLRKLLDGENIDESMHQVKKYLRQIAPRAHKPGHVLAREILLQWMGELYAALTVDMED